MAKIDLNGMQEKRKSREVETDIPEALASSYTEVWGKEKENVEYISINKIIPFKDKSGKGQPFSISAEKVEQIKASATDIGIITPLIVRKQGDFYQVISGHHRLEAARELNYISVPCVVKNLISDDEAVRFVAESNIQRTKLLPTEWAAIYSRYMDIRKDMDMTVSEIAEKFGISRKSLYRYVQITYLTNNLQRLIDEDILHTDTAEIFCKFSAENQETVYEFVKQTGYKINRALAKKIEALAVDKGTVTIKDLEELVQKPERKFKNKLYNSFADKYNVDYTEDEWNELVSSLIEQYFVKRT